MMQHKYPRLYSFTKNKNTSVAQFLTNNTLKAQFYLPLSVQALQEYQNLQEYIQTIQVHPDCKDSWQYIWGNNAYTSSRFYNLPYKNVQPPTPFTWIWNSKFCNELIVFSWLLLMEGNNYNCVLHNRNLEETTFHLFFGCPFSQNYWQQPDIHWNLGADFFQMITQAKQQFSSTFFMEIFIIGAWQIWKPRNNFIFDRGCPSLVSWKQIFVEEARLQAHRLCDSKRATFLSSLGLQG